MGEITKPLIRLALKPGVETYKPVSGNKIDFPQDVAWLRGLLHEAGYDADDEAVQSAHGDWSGTYCVPWLGLPVGSSYGSDPQIRALYLSLLLACMEETPSPLPLTLKVKLLCPHAYLPQREGPVGLVLRTPEPLTIDPGTRKAVRLGFAAAVPPDHVALIEESSSLAHTGVYVWMYTIRPSEIREWSVTLLLGRRRGERPVEISAGSKIARVVIRSVGAVVNDVDVVSVDDLELTPWGDEGSKE